MDLDALVAAALGTDQNAARAALLELDPVVWAARLAVMDATSTEARDPLVAAVLRYAESDPLAAGELLVTVARRLDSASGRAAATSWIDAVATHLPRSAWQPRMLIAAYELERARPGSSLARLEAAATTLEDLTAQLVSSPADAAPGSFATAELAAVADRVAASTASLLGHAPALAARVLAAVTSWLADDDPRAPLLVLHTAESLALAGDASAAAAVAEQLWDAPAPLGVRARVLRASAVAASEGPHRAGTLLDTWPRTSPADVLARSWIAAQLATGHDQARAALDECCAVLAASPAAARTAGVNPDTVLQAATLAGTPHGQLTSAARALTTAGAAGRTAAEILAASGDVELVEEIAASLPYDACVAAEVVIARARAATTDQTGLWAALDTAAILAKGFADHFRVAEVACLVEHPARARFAYTALAAALALSDTAAVAAAADVQADAGIAHHTHVDAALAAVEVCAAVEPPLRTVGWLAALVAAPRAARASSWRAVSALLADAATQLPDAAGELWVLAAQAALPFSPDTATRHAISAAAYPRVEHDVRLLLAEIGQTHPR